MALSETVSIIMPVLNEATNLESLLQRLSPMREMGVEIIMVDGGSHDGTVDMASPYVDEIITAPKGRATQMNEGAQVARGDILLFLHADTHLPDGAVNTVLEKLRESDKVWGRFDVQIVGQPMMLKFIAFMMNLRSRLTGIATGDQAIFVRSEHFFSVDGFPNQPLMEDIEISRRLKRLSDPVCIRDVVRTSGRRWEKHGVWLTIFLMWRLRFLYWIGCSAEKLARAYK